MQIILIKIFQSTNLTVELRKGILFIACFFGFKRKDLQQTEASEHHVFSQDALNDRLPHRISDLDFARHLRVHEGNRDCALSRSKVRGE